MKTSLRHLCATFALFCMAMVLHAQLLPVKQVTYTPFFFDTFKKATIHLENGKTVYVPYCNILYYNARIICLVDNLLRHPTNKDVESITFDDGTEFVHIKKQKMAQVIATHGNNSLLCLYSINTARYRLEHRKAPSDVFSRNLEYYQLGGLYYEEDSNGIPLLSKFYFRVGNKIVPASKGNVSKLVRQDMRNTFELLIKERFDWNAPEDLKRLLRFFP